MTLRALAGMLARNWRLKLAALGLSIFLWALVRVDGSDRRAVPIPVDVQLNEPGWMVVGQPMPSTVQVRFSGPAREIFRFGFDGASFTIPINEVSEEDMIVVLQESWIPTQGYPGVQVEDIVPSTVRLHLERVGTAVLPVRISTRGRIPAELAMTRSMGLTPDVVRVTGPQSLIDQLDSLDIVPADLGRVTPDGVLDVAIDAAGYEGLTVVPDRVSLRVPVEESTDRLLPSIPVQAAVASADEVVSVTPATVDLILRGGRTRVGAVDPARLRVLVPASALLGLAPAEERRVPVVVEGVPSFVDASVDTDSVTVRRSEQ